MKRILIIGNPMEIKKNSTEILYNNNLWTYQFNGISIQFLKDI